MSKELTKFYTEQFYKVKNITYELGKELMFGNYLNLCPKIKHEYKPFETFDESVKSSMNLMLNFIKDII